MTAHARHIVVVEAYCGLAEYLSDEPAEREGWWGLGLPLEELAEALHARFSVLCWDEWLELEHLGHLFTTWMPVPVTRPAEPVPLLWRVPQIGSPRVQRLPIPPTDPHHGHSLGLRKPSLRGFGLLADNDPLFYFSYRLNQELVRLHRQDPLSAVVLPHWGGLGYQPLLARATAIEESLDVPFALVVTDSSARRQAANQEGAWTREAVVRRQREDMSLALADQVLVFGARGAQLARSGRLPTAKPPVLVPRRVRRETLAGIERSLRQPPSGSPRFFLYEPAEPASGALLALDAARELRVRNGSAAPPLVCAGPDTRFAPMAPRSFRDYWSSRGFAAELLASGAWRWERERPRPDGCLPVRLYPSAFEYLPDLWTELSRGSLVLATEAAAEGLLGEAPLPDDVVAGEEPAELAGAISRLAQLDAAELERLRAALCEAVLDAQRGEPRACLFAAAVDALESLCADPGSPQPLDRVARLLLDRRRTLAQIQTDPTPQLPPSASAGHPGSLSVVVTCYELGGLIAETVSSVWASDRLPNELLLVDDGSSDAETQRVLADLESDANRRSLPLRIIRQPNQGLASARNRGLEEAAGEFISFLDGDDLIEPAYFGLALALLQPNPGLGGVAAWSVMFGDDGVEGHWNAPQPELPLLLTENCLFVPTVMRTALLRELGGYDPRQRYNYEDWELSVRTLAEGWPILTIPAYLQRYRVRGDSLYRTMTPVQNQGMRELMLERHRDTVARFGMEAAMLIENRLMRRVHAEPASARGTAARTADALVRVGRTALHTALRRVRAPR